MQVEALDEKVFLEMTLMALIACMQDLSSVDSGHRGLSVFFSFSQEEGDQQ